MDIVTLGQVLAAIAHPDVEFDVRLLKCQSVSTINGVKTYREGALKESASAIVKLISALRHDIHFTSHANVDHVLELERKMRALVQAVQDKRVLSRQHHQDVQVDSVVTSAERLLEDSKAAAAQVDALLLRLALAERYHTQFATPLASSLLSACAHN